MNVIEEFDSLIKELPHLETMASSVKASWGTASAVRLLKLEQARMGNEKMRRQRQPGKTHRRFSKEELITLITAYNENPLETDTWICNSLIEAGIFSPPVMRLQTKLCQLKNAGTIKRRIKVTPKQSFTHYQRRRIDEIIFDEYTTVRTVVAVCAIVHRRVRKELGITLGGCYARNRIYGMKKEGALPYRYNGVGKFRVREEGLHQSAFGVKSLGDIPFPDCH